VYRPNVLIGQKPTLGDKADNEGVSMSGEPNTASLGASGGEPSEEITSLLIDAGTRPAGEISAARANYIIRHWRGDLSLPVSFWINGTLLTVLLRVPAGFLHATFHSLDYKSLPLDYQTAVSISLLGLFVFSLPFGIWQLIGIWRSAEKRKSWGGRRGWAIAAQVWVVFGWLRFISAIFTLFGASPH
jgi:hypothetical protein